jgi:hypothetical protein
VSEASDYYNSLPFEERARLAPLLEEYRLLGMREVADSLSVLDLKMRTRMTNHQQLVDQMASNVKEIRS